MSVTRCKQGDNYVNEVNDIENNELAINRSAEVNTVKNDGLKNSIKVENSTDYFQQILAFPLDVQDNIIEDISSLPLCTKETIADVIAYYTMMVQNKIH